MDYRQSTSSSSDDRSEDLTCLSTTKLTSHQEAGELNLDETQKANKYRRLNKHQLERLEQEFLNGTNKTNPELAREIDVPVDRVKSWFINRQTKKKKEDREYQIRKMQTEKEHYRMEIAKLTAMMSRCSTCSQHIRATANIVGQANVIRQSSANDALANQIPLVCPSAQPVEAAGQGCLQMNKQPSVDFSQSLLGPCKVAKEAYEEIITLAAEADTWIRDILELVPHKMGRMLRMLHGRPPAGTRLVSSVETAVIQMTPLDLISTMLNVEKWASMLSNIVYHGSSDVLPAELQQLGSNAPEMLDLQMVKAEFHVPSPLVQPLRYQFLRYKRQVLQNMWAIVDVSVEYLLPTMQNPSSRSLKCRRRPSGLIIREHGDRCSQVIWIENLEVYDDGNGLQNIFGSLLIRSNSALSAKHWIVTFLQSLKRNCANFVTRDPALNLHGGKELLNLAGLMRMIYFERVNGRPDETKWIIKSDNGVRIMRRRATSLFSNSGSNTIYASTSFHLPAEPCSVFNFLYRRKSWLTNLESMEESEQMCWLTSDQSNTITLSKKGKRYFVEDVSRNECCYYHISSPITQARFGAVTTEPESCSSSTPSFPSGFVVLPVHSDHPRSVANSVVTIATNAKLDHLEPSQADRQAADYVNQISDEIFKNVLHSNWQASSQILEGHNEFTVI